MIHAYQEIYLNKAQSVLGEAFDYAVNICHIPGDGFIKQFTASSVSKRMENGELIIVDATHYKSVLINKYKNLITKYRYRAYVVDFSDISEEELIERKLS